MEPKTSDAILSDLTQFTKIKLGGGPITEEQVTAIRQKIALTASLEQHKDYCEVPYSTGDPCGKDKFSSINRALQKLFKFLKKVTKFADKYINGSINAIQDLEGEIRSTIDVIAANMRSIVQRVREWILKKIRAGIEDILNMILPPLLKQIKSGVLKTLIDQILCKFEQIIANLAKLIAEFLYSLVGQIINAPLCAAENFANALINKVANDIQQALDPIFAQINQVLGGVSQITASVFQAIDFVLGFEGFLCKGPECPEVKEYTTGGSGSGESRDDSKLDFSFLKISGQVNKSVEGWMNDFFGPRDEEYLSPGGCYSGSFECGIPQIQIFGGGGSGAVAAAVVNSIGQVIGANLFFKGSGYTSPPFVSIVDPAGCGVNASAYSVLGPPDPNNNNKSEVEKIIILGPGYGYSNEFNGGPPIINSFDGAPNPITVGTALILSWDVRNATKISLNVPGYSDLSPVQSISLPIYEEDVYFAPGETEAKVKYTLTAKNKNDKSEDQIVTRDLEITVVTKDQNLNSDINANPPTIDLFEPDPTVLSLGDVLTLKWQTSNTTKVSLDIPGFETVPFDGAISFVLPSNLKFPVDGSKLFQTYTLTAENSNAPIGQRVVTNTISVEIVKQVSTGSLLVSPDTGGTGGGGNVPVDTGTGGIVDTGGGVPADIGTGGISTGTGTGGIVDTGGGGGGIVDTGTGGIVDTGTGGIVDTGGIPTGTGTGGIVDTGGIPTGTGTGTGGIVDTGGGPGGTGTGGINQGGFSPNDAISEIDDVIIIDDSGTGYSPEDTVEIIGGNNGADFELELTPTGQIVNVKVISPGYGFVSIPDMIINSDTGVGARFRVNLKFTPIGQFIAEKQLELSAIGPQKLVQVIDCITR